MENLRWEDLDAAALKTWYEREQQELANALLRGATWDDVKEKRDTVTELSIQLYRRIAGNPSEHPSRPATE